SVADAIIASLPVKRRAELGIQGLVKRVRERVREERGEPRKPPKTSPLTVMKHRLSETEGKLADAEEKLAGDGTPRVTSALGSSMTGPDGGQIPGHGEREAMLTVFVDPFNRTISPFRIPSNPTPKLLLQIISGSRLLSASIAYET